MAEALVGTYHVTRSVLCRLRERRLGLVAADRGMAAAERSATQLMSLAARNVAMAHLESDDPAAALDFATAAARRIGRQQHIRTRAQAAVEQAAKRRQIIATSTGRGVGFHRRTGMFDNGSHGHRPFYRDL